MWITGQEFLQSLAYRNGELTSTVLDGSLDNGRVCIRIFVNWLRPTKLDRDSTRVLFPSNTSRLLWEDGLQVQRP